MRAPAEAPRYAVEVDARRRLGWDDVGEIVRNADVDAYRIPPVDGRPRYRLVGTLPQLRDALLDWVTPPDDEDDYSNDALDLLAAAVPVDRTFGARGAGDGVTAYGLLGLLTRYGGQLLADGAEVAVWVRYAGHLHEVVGVTMGRTSTEGSPPNADVPYRPDRPVLLLDLGAPHALVDAALDSDREEGRLR